MSSFATYLIGFVVLTAGLAYGAYLVNIPSTWIVVGVVVLVGIGIVTATSRTKMRDPADGAASTNRAPPTSPTA